MPQRKFPIHLQLKDTNNCFYIVYVTVCTEKRKPILHNRAAHDLLLNSWKIADAWVVGRYIIMPNHIHLFCSPAQTNTCALSKWVQFWKSLTSCDWPNPADQPIWQRSFWDTQILGDEQYSEKYEYMLQNPVRKHLVKEPEEWLYQGELGQLKW